MFEKFVYREPLDDIKNKYRPEWDFATYCVLIEFSYMTDSRLVPIGSTSKNQDSIPGYPKFFWFSTEKEYLDKCGQREYFQLWDKIKDPEFTESPVWYSFLKMEPTTLDKIESEDYRMIMCTDPCYTRIGAVFEQHQNELMKEHTHQRAGQMGWCPFKGGLDRTLRRISSGMTKFLELDWTRFDGTIPAEVLLHIKNIRWFLLDPAYKTPENWQRHKWYVEQLVNKYVLIPTGEVTMIDRGNPSGQISTTSDNIFVNVFLTAFEYVYQAEREGRTVTPEQFFMDHKMVCYGDDRLSGVNYEPNIDMIVKMYADIFGMWVKPTKIKISNSLEGTSFCGFVFKKHHGKWVGEVNVDKLCSTLKEPVKQLPDIEALWAKLVSLRILMEHSDQETREQLDFNIRRVEQAMRAEGMEPVKLPRQFYHDIW
uniref:Non-structural polyprotein 1AB n=1 Tax=Hainan oriental leaf-toed gecko astrovirus 2 TaxID=2116134 RepID=A0A2P1GNI0_9VIRU|nr:ORF1b [Hainan oriental leaf-toed gecko astrovirus 2]